MSIFNDPAHRKAVIGRTRIELARARGAFLICVITFVLAIGAAASLVARENIHLPWKKTYAVHVRVTDARGVVPGRDEVRWAGVVVGRITGVKLKDGKPDLTVQVDRSKAGGAHLYKNAEMELRPQTVLQDVYLDIRKRGTPSAGELKNGDTLDAARTKVPVNIADVMDVFSDDVRDNLVELTDNLGVGLKDNGAQLRSAFTYIVPLLDAQHKLSNALATRAQTVKSLVHDTRVLFDTLGVRDQQLTRLIEAGAATLQTTAGNRDALDQTLKALPPTLAQMRDSFARLDQTLDVVRPALRDLRPAARALPSGLAALRGFSVAATPALRALQPAVDALIPLAKQLAPTAVSLDGAFAALAPQVPRFDEVTADITPCETFVQKFFAYTQSVLKYGSAADRSDSPRGVLDESSDDLLSQTGNNGVIKSLKGCADGKDASK